MPVMDEVMVGIPEDDLVARCRGGDLDAFGRVYADYERHVFRLAYHILGHRDDADDVKQETFLRAYRGLDTFRGDCSLKTWLLRICANLCRDRIKSRDRRPEILFDPVEVPDVHLRDDRAVDPHEMVERGEAVATLRSALKGMPAEQREIIILRDIEDMSYEEVAEALGCTRASVKIRLFRARQRLRERVEALMAARR